MVELRHALELRHRLEPQVGEWKLRGKVRGRSGRHPAKLRVKDGPRLGKVPAQGEPLCCPSHAETTYTRSALRGGFVTSPWRTAVQKINVSSSSPSNTGPKGKRLQAQHLLFL